ncbi:hypothetical protein UlMin_036584 [Ulmus minor]
MVRDELYISVPSLFRCPISMDVMRSPVSLCTGVTYDRTSIEHWLDSGHDTCPATMQTLPSKDFVPNLTLRRLINLWALSHGPPSPSSASPSVSGQQLRSLINKLDFATGNENENLCDSLSKIVDFASVGDENRRFLANFDGFVSAIVGALSKGVAQLENLELVIRVLDSILRVNGVKELVWGLIRKSNQNCLPSICLILRNGSLKSKIASARILELITADAEFKRAIAENKNLLQELFNLLSSETDQDLYAAVLSCFIAVSATRSTKAELVGSGLVQILTTMLSSPNAGNLVSQKSLKLISILSTCAEGRSAISKEEKCTAAVVERLLKVSKAATEDGVAVLWSMCCCLGDKKTQETVVRSNGMAKILLVMQSGYCEGHPVRKMCGDLLKVLRIGCKFDSFGSYETKTTHIMPC